MDKYHIIVIGAGSGGLSIGLSMHELGFKVLLIEQYEENIGGECLNTGCIPSKALIHASRLVHKAKEAELFGIKSSGKADLKSVLEYVRQKQQIIRDHENAQYFRDQGMDVVIGKAEFVGKLSVKVGDETYYGKKIAIATGSKPAKLKVPGVEMVKYLDNENIFQLDQLPERLLMVGAGPISMEIGQAFSRFGSKVTMVEVFDRILINEHPEIAQVLFEKVQEEGISFHLSSKLLRFEGENQAIIEAADGSHQALDFDAVFVGIGRKIYTDGLNLDQAGIKTENGKIVSNAYLQTSNKNVYVIGDVVDSLKFSHGAEWQATIMVNNFLSPLKKKLNYDHFSWVTFTDPEIATFGLSEQEIQNRNIKYEKLVYDFSQDDRAIVDDYQYGKTILFVKPSVSPMGDMKLLGGSMVAPNAGELFQELVLAHSSGLGLKKLFDKTYAYPTGGRVNKTIAINRYLSRMTPTIKRILKFMYKLS